MAPSARVLRLAVRIYQLVLRPVLGPNCRFTPSCSDYALDALDLHGSWRGSGLAIRRVLRCNPWCDGGHDPVPSDLLDSTPLPNTAPLPNIERPAAH